MMFDIPSDFRHPTEEDSVIVLFLSHNYIL